MPRSPEYDRDTVVAQATAVFWERGYGRTSINHIVAATGLKPGSLYAAFGSKKGMFLEVINRYNGDFVDKIRRLRRAGGSPLARLTKLLDEIVEDTVTGRDRRGCLTVNSLLELSQHDADIAASLAKHNERIRNAFGDLIRDAQDDGEIPSSSDAGDLAAFLMNNIWGMRVLCKSNPPRKSLNAVVSGVVASLRSG